MGVPVIPANEIAAGGARMVEKGCASIDFWTPEKIIAPVRSYFAALGHGDRIALDPATAPSNPTGARSFYTPADNGLTRGWVDGTFVNPPYGSALYLWVPKIAEEARAGHAIVALLPGQRFDQPYWLEHLVSHQQLTAICFVVGRIQFKTPGGGVAKGNPYGSMLWILNGNYGAAIDAFSSVGALLAPGHRFPWAPSNKARERSKRDFARAQERARQGQLFGAAGRIAAPRPARGGA